MVSRTLAVRKRRHRLARSAKGLGHFVVFGFVFVLVVAEIDGNVMLSWRRAAGLGRRSDSNVLLLRA